MHLVDHDPTLDLSVANGPDDRMVLVATEPLTRNETWQPFAAGELQVFVAGEQVWRHVPASRGQAAAASVPGCDKGLAPGTRLPSPAPTALSATSRR